MNPEGYIAEHVRGLLVGHPRFLCDCIGDASSNFPGNW